MNYTDRFFEFPVRIYDGFELRKALEQEEKSLDDDVENAEPIESPFAVGVAAVLPESILGYTETFSKVKTVGEVVEKGFDLVMVETKDQGDYICTWGRKRFKEELNKFMKKLSEARMEESRAVKYNTTNTGGNLAGRNPL